MIEANPTTHFQRYWETTIRPGTPFEVVQKWRDYVCSGIDRAGHIRRTLERYRPLLGARVLDLGCGYGGAAIAFRVAGAAVIGIDPNYVFLEGARVRAVNDCGLTDIVFCRGVGEALPLADGSVDFIICEDVVEHVSTRPRLTAEMARVLARNGFIYLSFPSRLSLTNMLRDPHYGLLGVSFLPRTLAEPYVVKVRKRAPEYTVTSLPVPSLLRRTIERNGLRVIAQEPVMRRSFGPVTRIVRAFRDNTLPLTHWVLVRAVTPAEFGLSSPSQGSYPSALDQS